MTKQSVTGFFGLSKYAYKPPAYFLLSQCIPLHPTIHPQITGSKESMIQGALPVSTWSPEKPMA